MFQYDLSDTRKPKQTMSHFLSEEQFQCSICLEIFDNPVSTPCGHSFCTACIGHYWQGSKLCQCPLCKESFKKRPELHINRTLREITEQFKQMKCEAGACGGSGWLGSSLEERPLKQGGLLGDLFLEMKCQNGCDSDSGQSQEVTRRLSLRRYTLSGAADARKVPRCPKHRHKLELFCKSDGECICSECSDTDHQSHKIISVEKEWLISKTEIGMTETKMQEMIGQRLRKIEEIKILLAEIKMAAEKEMQGGMRIFGLLLSSVERSQAELLEVIEMSRRSAEHQAEVMIRELDLELTELRKRSAMLGKLAQTDDCISGLRSYCNLNTPVPVKDWAGVSVHCDLGKTKAIYNSVSQLLQHFREELQKLPEILDVKLNPDTAHPRLILSEDRKKVRCSNKHQLVPSNPERFDRVVCVLGQEGFTGGQHYWEVEVGGKTDWDLGVASHSINRKGKLAVSPSNGYWFLSLREKSNYAFRTEPSTTLLLSLKPQKIGVFVDYEKGQVSFYNVEAKMHIYTFSDTFTETIYPFFSPCTNKSGKNDVPLTITPVLPPD
uniref:E3 ubiquitin-protein ligase TRIM39-like n=1 Tax=Electrophorus electricus TaxID=8005 RepID=A0A4W4H2B8_ELEEL